MMENRSPDQKYKSAVCDFYWTAAERSGGLACTSNLDVACAGQQTHVHAALIRALCGQRWVHLHQWLRAKHIHS